MIHLIVFLTLHNTTQTHFLLKFEELKQILYELSPKMCLQKCFHKWKNIGSLEQFWKVPRGIFKNTTHVLNELWSQSINVKNIFLLKQTKQGRLLHVE